ncbi:MAG TPA: (d)CMP kinase [Candidatus Nesterenkonia stercoripullorum]|uniref:Cytidylate kinase n=1 Tax=Candidatus Nesterenkonia stercoripullorum TaxID=2838701 RepID=A0A9D1S371_9MICC|nr:(d)CMP kinase [Candidatus Nesterenkonia stercoripullorum]
MGHTSTRTNHSAGESARLVIAVDGPSGSGKSSVCQEAARRLGAHYLDTGAMYRAATWYCLDRELDLDDQDAVAVALEELPLKISTDPDHQVIMVGATDVTEAIRQSRISEKVSEVANNRKARPLLISAQRDIIDASEFIVAEGRDVTTVVAPDAQVRVLLTASAEVRLARRGLQLGGSASSEALNRQVIGRDKRDSVTTNFTEAADGVGVLDSSDLSFDQTVDSLIERVRDVQETDPAGVSRPTVSAQAKSGSEPTSGAAAHGKNL